MKNRPLDITLTIVLSLVSLVVGVLLELIVVMFPMRSDACGVNTCNVPVMEGTLWVGLFGTPIIIVLFIVLAIRRLVQQRKAWPWPIFGILDSLAFVVAVALVMALAVQGVFGGS